MNLVTKILIGICAVILLFGLFIGGYAYQKYQNKNKLRELQYNLDSTNFQLKKWRDAAGGERAQVPVQQLDITQLQALHRADIDKLRNELGRDFKSLQSTTKAAIETFGTKQGTLTDSLIITNVVNRSPDTVIAQKFAFNDNWLKMRGLVIKDKIEIDYRIKNDVTFSTFYAHDKGIKGWFKKPVLNVVMASENPNSQITGLQSIVVKTPAKKWWQTKGFAFGVGVALGAVGIAGVGIALHK